MQNMSGLGIRIRIYTSNLLSELSVEDRRCNRLAHLPDGGLKFAQQTALRVNFYKERVRATLLSFTLPKKL